MHVGILFNPSAGRGRGEAAALDIERALTRARMRVKKASVRDGPTGFATLRKGIDALVIAGGDGTLHHALASLADSRLPVYHAAMGTENLFAREFGHCATPASVLAALRHGRARDIDLAVLEHAPASGAWHKDPSLFSIVASIGPDASIVHRLCATRSGPIRHLSYIRPILKELPDPTLPVMSVRVGNQVLAEQEPGALFVANMRQYALRINPLRTADPADGMLDALFVPATDIATYLSGLVWMRARVPSLAWGGRVARGTELLVQVHSAKVVVQADGEPVWTKDGTSRTLSRWIRATASPGSLRVIET